ncbi:MAG: mechanosensitive ion channel [Gammaproteobacteria bacterium]|nr:mechanosensitive ion channel [Gammaproteobacteria bacterium]
MLRFSRVPIAWIFTIVFLLPVLSAAAAEPQGALAAEEIDRVLATLENAEQRDQLIATLRTLRAASDEQKANSERESVKTAAADLVERVAARARDVSRSATGLLESAVEAPVVVLQWAEQLEQPATRERWLTVAWRLFAVLGAGFLVAGVLRYLLRRVARTTQAANPSLLRRVGLLLARLVVDVIPIIVFALVAYAVLAVVDPHQDTRLVAVALINASILSRIIIALAAFLLSPESGRLRLWTVSDESANYVYQWTHRLSGIAIYGFFGLQAAFLLGMSTDAYDSLLRILGLVILLMLLVLIAQNRQDVARALTAETASDIDEPATVSSLRRGLARVWHLLAGAYLLIIYGIWALRIENGAAYLLRATALTLLALAVARLLARALDQLFERGIRLSDDLQRQHPGLEKRLNRYFPVLRKIAKALLVAATFLFVAYAWGIDTLAWITEGSGRVLLGAILHILLVLAIAFVVWEFASGSIQNYLAETDSDGRTQVRSARTRTLLTVARNALLVVLTVVTVLMILSELGLNIGPLLAGAGVVGLAIGFGAQKLVQDVINGAFILFQDLMAVGDVVKLGDKAGVVEALSIRTVRLRDLAGVVHTIPFNSIEAVSNLTREYSFHVFDLGIAYREDVDQVIALIKDVGEQLRADAEIGPLILEPLEVFGLDQFGDSAIVIKGRIKTKPIKQWQVGRAFNRLIKQRFDAEGIEIPFPHQTIYFGQDKDGVAPPAFLRLEQALAASQDGMTAQDAGDEAPRT